MSLNKLYKVGRPQKITFDRAISFCQKSIFIQFEVSTVLIADNRKQFTSKKFKDFYAIWRIDLRLTLVYHPQSNGITKVTNRTILQELEKHLDDAKKNWPKELQACYGHIAPPHE